LHLFVFRNTNCVLYLSQRPFGTTGSAIYAFDDADSLLNKIDSTSSAVQDVVQKVAEAAPAVLDAAPSKVLVEKAIEVAAETTTTAGGGAASGGVLDSLPLPLIAGVLIAAAAAAVVLGGGAKITDSPAAAAPAVAASPSTSASADADAVDISIPYDAAAMLAYEKAGTPGDFDTYKVKYYADAVADVKAKQKQKA
jgi:hypothetical protein